MSGVSNTKGRIFAIDLGATYSSIGRYREETRQVCVAQLDCEQGSQLLPSPVFVESAGNVIVGSAAVQAGVHRPERLFRWFMRDLGAPANPSWVIDGVQWTPTDCSAEILRALKREGELFFATEVKDVVLTFPAWFTSAQKDLTREAAVRAGLNVIRMVEKPQAAVLAYVIEEVLSHLGQHGQPDCGLADIIPQITEGLAAGRGPILVYDLGGSTFDIGLVQLQGEPLPDGNAALHLKTLYNDGNVSLGGKDWDGIIKDIVCKADQERYAHDPMSDPQGGCMDEDCERAKKDLMDFDSTTIVCQRLHQIQVTREQVEQATKHLLDETEAITQTVLARAEKEFGIRKDDITVLLCGGMTRWPAVEPMLTRVMDGRPPLKHRNPDCLGTYGAAYLVYVPVTIEERAWGPVSQAQSKSPQYGPVLGIDFGTSSSGLVMADAQPQSPAVFEKGMFRHAILAGAGSPVDRVHFTVTSPPIVRPGDSFVLGIWAHLEQQRPEVLRRAREAFGTSDVRIQSKGPVRVSRGAALSVRLKLEGLAVEDPEDTILWEGDIGTATFLIIVPGDATAGLRSGIATIHLDGLQIARIYFIIEVGKRSTEVTSIPAREERHSKAFASYASPDRDAVLARVQGMQKAAPRLEFNLDVLTLRSGQYWEQELWNIIPTNDVFYLFWSRYAADSPWVDKEWRCALNTRGLDFIDPVPLASPEEVPPPPELASKHFNDWVLAYMRGTEGRSHA